LSLFVSLFSACTLYLSSMIKLSHS
jgi:hypothetical protein